MLRSVFALSFLACGIVTVCLGAENVVLQTDFSRGSTESQVVVLVGNAHLGDGIIRSASLADWQRSGVKIGPVPMPDGSLIVEYDFRALRFGSQGQEFTSQAPSTHWYMAYADRNGRVHLHTRHEGQWLHRAASPVMLELNKWYRERVLLTRASIAIRITDKATGQVFWETLSAVPVDDIGKELEFILCDEAPTTDEAVTEWDHLVLSTDDPSFPKRFAAWEKRLVDEKHDRERRQRAVAALRERGIALIPMPQVVELRNGEYRLSTPLRLAARSGCEDADLQAVRTAFGDRLERPVRLVGARETADVVLQRPRGRTACSTLTPQSYQLTVSNKGIVLEAQSPRSFFYAAHTLCQLTDRSGRVPATAISDSPAIAHRLIMIAIDQGGFQMIDMPYWKRLIRELSAVKITHIMPYFEGAGFLYERHPYLAARGHDGFTRDKARELSEYAHQRFVELVPQQQSLGHAGAMLYHEQLKDLRESGDVFCSSNPRTFAFLGDLYDELVIAFPYSRYIHIGGDEFGHGFSKCPQCLARAEAIGKAGVYAEHMMRLREMLKQRNRDMMIWRHEQGYTEEAAERLSKDIVVFDWHYGNQSSYPSLARLQQKGFVHTWATPAVTRYYDPGNDFNNTFGNIQGFMRAGAKDKVPGACTCTWVHGIWGGRNLFELNLYALLWSAECSWNPAASDVNTFQWKYARHWFELEGKDRGAEVLRAVHVPFGEPQDQKFWRNNGILEPIIAETPAATVKRIGEKPELVAEAESLLRECAASRAVLERWRKEVKRNRVTVDFLLHDVRIHEAAARKILATHSLIRAWAEARDKPVAERADALAQPISQYKQLIADLHAIETMFHRSVREAGGGKCGWGGWVPFIVKGGIQFRSPEGRKGIEEFLARLNDLSVKEMWPETPF